MSFLSIWNELFPAIALLVLGYSLARWFGLNASALSVLLRYLFLPVVIFTLLEARMPFSMLLKVGVIGAATVVFGWTLARQAHRFLAPKVDSAAALPNVACFMIPFIVLGLGSRGAGTACAFFVGAVIAMQFLESRKNLGLFFYEPWFYAVIAAVIFQVTNFSSPRLDRVLTPLLSASYPIFLIFLGAYLDPFEGFKDPGAWVTVGVRVISGFLIGILGIYLFRLPPAVAEGVIFAAIAPPSTKGLYLTESGGGGSSSKGAASLGTIISIVILFILMKTNWQPWNL